MPLVPVDTPRRGRLVPIGDQRRDPLAQTTAGAASPRQGNPLQDMAIENTGDLADIVSKVSSIPGFSGLAAVGKMAAKNPELVKKVLKAANIPADKVREVLRTQTAKIPEGKGRKVADFAADTVADTFSPEGMAFQATGGKAMEAVVGPRVEKALARAMGHLNRIQSGTRRQAGERLFRDPLALLKGLFAERAGKRLGAVREAAGMVEKPTVSEIVDTTGESSRKIAEQVLTALEEGQQVGAAQLLKAKQALGNLLEATPFPQKNRRRLLSEAQQRVSDMLGQLSGEEAEASAEFARSALGREFLRLFPVTKSGDVSLTRTLFLPTLGDGSGFLASLPVALAQSPLLGGGLTAGAGISFKAARALLQNPAVQRTLLAIIAGQALQEGEGGEPPLERTAPTPPPEKPRFMAQGKARAFRSMQEAREASKNLPEGTEITIGGVRAVIRSPGRERGQGAPKAIQFLESPPEGLV